MNNTSTLTTEQGPNTNVEAAASAQQSVLGFVLAHLPSFLYRLVTFATISIPLFFYRVLTWSFTLHLNFTSIVVIVGFVATCTWLIVRYRFLTTYSRLKPIQPPKPAGSFDLHPDAADDQEYIKSGLKSYPDEFLSAFLSSIKVFGYLEQPVFHELARHLQTRRLLAGDTLFKNPEQERSFYIVVDGNVQVFIKPSNNEVNSDDEDELNGSDTDEYGNERLKNHTLLNEVGAGGTLSSLFTILSLFSENTEKPTQPKQKRRPSPYAQHAEGEDLESSREGSQESWGQVFRQLDQSDLDVGFIEGVRRKADLKSPPLTYKQLDEHDDLSDLGDESDIRITANTSFSKEDGTRSWMKPALMKKAAYRQQRTVHPGIIARATVDTTLAVIPAEAFHKLTHKFPKAAAHIVQVILTRFQRVTFLTGHKYLGLTKELLRAERLANESASLNSLPEEFFMPGGLDRLRHKFAKDDKPFKIASEAGDDEKSSLTSDSVNDRPSIIQAMNISERHPSPSPSMDASSGSNLNIPVSKSGKGHIRRASVIHGNGDYSIEDDRHLRASVMACVSQSLGLRCFSSVDHTPAHSENGLNRSPPTSHLDLGKSRYYPMDLFSHTGVRDESGSPSIGPISMGSDDIEVMSTASSVSNSEANFEPRFGATVNANDVQILYYPKDAVLVKEGEQNRGLFFVIDGLLEVSMSPIDGEDEVLPKQTKPIATNSSRNPKRRRASALRHSINRHTSFIDDPFATKALSPDSYSDKKKAAEPNEAQQRRTVMFEAPAGRSYDNEGSKYKQSRTKKPLFSIKAGGLAGYLAAMSGYSSFVEIRAATDTFVGYITKQTLERIIDRNPIVMLTLAKRLISILSPLSKLK
jgi:lysophospholipid hydrolase